MISIWQSRLFPRVLKESKMEVTVPEYKVLPKTSLPGPNFCYLEAQNSGLVCSSIAKGTGFGPSIVLKRVMTEMANTFAGEGHQGFAEDSIGHRHPPFYTWREVIA
jgi:hypothetical protein